MEEFTIQVMNFLRSIPKGKVVTYGYVAKACGRPGSARQVARILHSMSRKHNLPWHRVINAQGKISLTGTQLDIQQALLESEGVEVSETKKIDLSRFHL